MSKRKGYIAGPMRGYDKFNFPAFDAAASTWRAQGWEIVSPAEMDREAGLDPSKYTLPDDPAERREALAEFIQRDVGAICDGCTAIILLPGWEASRGAVLECALGRYLGLDLLDAESGESVDNPEPILVEADRIVKGDRNDAYGHPSRDFEATGLIWTGVLRPLLRDGAIIPPEAVGLCMIGVKMSRESRVHRRDNLVDAAGYAKTVAMCHGED